MKKPFYKKWWFWVIIVIAGIIGIFNKQDSVPTEVATPTEEAQSAVVEPTTDPTEAPTQKPTESPTEAPVVAEQTAEVPEYEIVNERLDKSGMWYLTLSTESTDEAQLEALVENGRVLALEQKNGATSVFIDIQLPDDPALIAKGKIALSQKGVAQTGLKKVGDSEFEILK
jgi:outer membrane biosynthesis protein TonB